MAEGGNTNVAAADQYGGAGTGTVMDSGGSQFLNAGATGTPEGSTGNNVELLDENDKVLTAMTTDGLMVFLNSPSNVTMTALDGTTTYNRAQYNGNPFVARNDGEPYVYLNYVLKDTTQFGSITIKKIRFWGAGFELDNIAVREEKLPGLPAETGLPQSWVPTKINNVFEDPPATADDAESTRINTPSAPLDLTLNDPHMPAGSSVTPQTSAANGGTIAADPDNAGKFIYTPAAGFVGVDTFSYQVCLAAPNQAKCATSVVTMTVTAPDLAIDLSGLGSTATVGLPYQGQFSCSNQGSSDQDGASCIASGLPAGITQGLGACSIVTPAAPAPVSWTSPSPIPEGAVVSCPVEGKPTEAGSYAVSGTGAQSKASKDISISAVYVPTAVPSLSTWALLMMAGVLAVLGLGRARKQGL